jgi:electron transfer flavoprotein beta subunit
MNAPKKVGPIAVLVSVGRHRVSSAPCYSRNDALALEIGRNLARIHGASLEVIHVGDASNPALEDYLALGAGRIDVIECRAGDDAAAALAGRLQGAPLVLTGTRAEGAFGSGMLPYRLAAELEYALIDSALDVAIGDGRVSVTQFMPKGARRRVDAALPAVIAVHPQAAMQPRYAYARIPDGSITRSVMPMRRDTEFGEWHVGDVQRRPIKLVAAEKRTGHARMTMATTTESRGGNVVIEGTSVEKAQVVLDYLREHRLIDY